MSEVPAAVGFDRLPWLADDLQPRAVRPRRRKLRMREWLGWAVAALLMIAGASYWVGVRTAGNLPAESDLDRLAPPVTVPLPAPRDVPRSQPPQVAIKPAPEVEPIAAPPPVEIQSAPKSRPATARRAKPKASKASNSSRAPSAQAALPALWPVRVEAGASGRMVRIGAFATRQQAKRGWVRIMRFYPGMSRLPALVVAQPSLRDRRTYYRLQMGTTSQAHSEVLCQRMRTIAQSCVVVDLPGQNRNSGTKQ